jgi:hypothetical protein
MGINSIEKIKNKKKLKYFLGHIKEDANGNQFVRIYIK